MVQYIILDSTKKLKLVYFYRKLYNQQRFGTHFITFLFYILLLLVLPLSTLELLVTFEAF